MKPIVRTHGPHPEEVARSLLRVTVSKDGRSTISRCARAGKIARGSRGYAVSIAE